MTCSQISLCSSTCKWMHTSWTNGYNEFFTNKEISSFIKSAELEAKAQTQLPILLPVLCICKIWHVHHHLNLIFISKLSVNGKISRNSVFSVQMLAGKTEDTEDAEAYRLVRQCCHKLTLFPRKEKIYNVSFNAEFARMHQWLRICCSSFAQFLKMFSSPDNSQIPWFVEGVWWYCSDEINGWVS